MDCLSFRQKPLDGSDTVNRIVNLCKRLALAKPELTKNKDISGSEESVLLSLASLEVLSEYVLDTALEITKSNEVDKEKRNVINEALVLLPLPPESILQAIL